MLALSFLFVAPATAQTFWIPAEEFSEHTDVALEGALDVDDDTGMPVQLLGDGQQVRIQIGLNDDLRQYLQEHSVFQVCSFVANYDSRAINSVRSRHSDPLRTQTHILDEGDDYETVCSEYGSIDTSNFQTAGLRVFPPSPGVVKVRGVSFRGVDTETSNNLALADYEYSRALGYLWGDGGVASDDISFFFRRSTSSTSRHFGSVATSHFGNAVSQSSQGHRYLLDLDGTDAERFLVNRMRLSDVPDKKAFLTSVIETEGAVLVGRLADDPNIMRCEFLKALVDDLNPRCSANTCTDGSCSTPNCAFVANGRSRGTPYQEGRNCGVYLSGNSDNWKSLFSGRDYHFVKTDRTPGGEPRQNSPDSRPAYTSARNTSTTETQAVANNQVGYVFSRTDKSELRWVARSESGEIGNIWINQACSESLGGPTAFGDWNRLLTVSPAVDTIANPCR